MEISVAPAAIDPAVVLRTQLRRYSLPLSSGVTSKTAARSPVMATATAFAFEPFV
jgi:hypothetical protein